MNKQTISNDFYNMTKEEKLKYRTQCAKNALKEYRYRQTLKQESAYCDRNICLKNEYNGIGCDECEVTKSGDDYKYIKSISKPTGVDFGNLEQEPKTGHWRAIYQGDEIIDYRCSECEFGSTFGKSTYRMNYCPNCGAKMIKP